MPNKTLTVDQVLTLLSETPARLDELTSSVQAARLRTPADGDWSANDVLAHLRACADVWGGCMASIAQGAETLRAVNPLSWIDKTDYRSRAFKRSLLEFAQQREQLLSDLNRIPRARWTRTATVTGAGAALRRDMLFYGRWMAGHERAHVKQVARMVGRA